MNRSGKFRSITAAFRDFVLILLVAVAATALVMFGLRVAGLKFYAISGDSMNPAFSSGDMVFVKNRDLTIGDVIFFTKPVSWSIAEDNSRGTVLVKRVAATSGDRVEFDGSTFQVNGREKFSVDSFDCMRSLPYSHTLTENEVLVFGDNADRSYDSRRIFCDDEENFLINSNNVISSGKVLLHF